MSTRDYDFQGFDRIRVSGAFEFNITRADAFKVSITSDPFKVIEVSREGDTLRIGIAWYTYLWWFLTWWSHPSASITLPELRELRISGASHGETGDFDTTHDFSAELEGASGLSLGNISAGNVDFRVKGASNLEFKKVKGAKGSVNILGASRIKGEFELSGDVRLDVLGASRVELSGSAYDAVIDIKGASQGKLERFTVHNAKLKVAGASSAVVKADGRLDIDAMGASNVSWVGNPTMGDVRSGGASTLHKA
ncbi:MAG: hypothetical protein C4542_02840 [Dehalococcoidia bacterium]|nr:MAG: hypothetical protein C4542_02840 [Dehalococcoidia bacterium]